jgi:hypothetical protein
LPPNNASYVLDNFNVTEGITRVNSPVWLSSSTATNKHIASNISTTLNLTISLAADCEHLGSVIYVSNTSTYRINYTASGGWFYSGQTYTCANDLVTMQNVPIERATNSNEFTLIYNAGALNACNSGVNAFASYIALLGLVGVIFFLGLVIFYLTGIIDKQRAQNVGVVGVVVTIIMIGLLLVISIFLMSTLCGLF